MNNDPDNLIHQLAQSRIYGDYERAFGETTGLPLTLSSVDDWHLAHQGRRHENPFCALFAAQNKTCASCLRTQHELATTAREQTQTVTCPVGLCETAVPLRLGDRLIGFLRTGEVLLHTPTKRHFSQIVRQLKKWGSRIELGALREAYFQTRVLSRKQYAATVDLLQIFAQHLSMISNQVAVHAENAEPPNITRAREYIAAHHTENLSLSQVARAVHMSTFYFCKQFKKATGCTFTEYLARVRVEAAKARLLNPQERVSETAFQVGFQSITHFNRIFRKVVGQSPTDYRATLQKAA